jgi:hypothetical protein
MRGFLDWVVFLTVFCFVGLYLQGCTITVTADIPSKQIQDWFTGKKK